MKNKIIKIILSLIFAFSACFGGSKIPVSNNKTLDKIINVTRSTFGDNYSVNGYKDLDSLQAGGMIRDFNYNPHTDPYGTLKKSVIFWITRNKPDSIYDFENGNITDTSIVCIMKNDRLIWHTGTEIIGDVSSLLFSFDLNKDGKVDLGLIVQEPGKTNFSLLYIISWNGRKGELISDVDQTKRSVIISEGNLFEIFDPDDNGIYDIRGCWARDDDEGSGWFPSQNPSSTAPYVTYGWNGYKYGFWQDIKQLPGYEFLPANRIKLITGCVVSVEGGEFKYSYVFKSDIKSKQLINQIYIENVDSIETTAFGPWAGGFSWILDSYYWSPLSLNRNEMIKAGEEKHGFGFLSFRLPAIKNVYAQGLAPLGDVASDARTDDKIITDVETNSYETKTIGPGYFDDQSNLGSFLDTLISYTHQCATLGWLRDEERKKGKGYNRYEAGVVEILTHMLNSARLSLVKNDSVMSRQELELFVKEIEQLYTENKHAERERPLITSEGYALLKYNAEYLTDKLPLRERRGR